jgi:hypothetical protein
MRTIFTRAKVWTFCRDWVICSDVRWLYSS